MPIARRAQPARKRAEGDIFVSGIVKNVRANWNDDTTEPLQHGSAAIARTRRNAEQARRPRDGNGELGRLIKEGYAGDVGWA